MQIVRDWRSKQFPQRRSWKFAPAAVEPRSPLHPASRRLKVDGIVETCLNLHFIPDVETAKEKQELLQVPNRFLRLRVAPAINSQNQRVLCVQLNLNWRNSSERQPVQLLMRFFTRSRVECDLFRSSFISRMKAFSIVKHCAYCTIDFNNKRNAFSIAKRPVYYTNGHFSINPCWSIVILLFYENGNCCWWFLLSLPNIRFIFKQFLIGNECITKETFSALLNAAWKGHFFSIWYFSRSFDRKNGRKVAKRR